MTRNISTSWKILNFSRSTRCSTEFLCTVSVPSRILKRCYSNVKHGAKLRQTFGWKGGIWPLCQHSCKTTPRSNFRLKVYKDLQPRLSLVQRRKLVRSLYILMNVVREQRRLIDWPNWSTSFFLSVTEVLAIKGMIYRQANLYITYIARKKSSDISLLCIALASTMN